MNQQFPLPVLRACQERPRNGGPAGTAPLHRSVSVSQNRRTWTLGRRLISRDRFRDRIGKHDRATEGSVPQLPALALAQSLCLLEKLRRALLIDLSEARQGQQEQSEYSIQRSTSSTSTLSRASRSLETHSRRSPGWQ